MKTGKLVISQTTTDSGNKRINKEKHGQVTNNPSGGQAKSIYNCVINHRCTF